MAIIVIKVPIVILTGKVRNTAQCVIEVDTARGEVDSSNFPTVLRTTFAKHLRDMADTVERDGIAAVQSAEYEIPEATENDAE